jgi:hypothetical protein
MMAPSQFDPVAIIVALERHGVDYVLIGGLAQVLRGADIVTGDVDICPSFASGNLERLNEALAKLRPSGTEATTVGEQELAHGPVEVPTEHGELKVVGSPLGVRNGFVALRRAATRERIGRGIAPLTASAGDLAAMVGALGREQDRERLGMLRRLVELEAGHHPSPPTSEQARMAPSQRMRRAPRTTR